MMFAKIAPLLKAASKASLSNTVSSTEPTGVKKPQDMKGKCGQKLEPKMGPGPQLHNVSQSQDVSKSVAQQDQTISPSKNQGESPLSVSSNNDPFLQSKVSHHNIDQSLVLNSFNKIQKANDSAYLLGLGQIGALMHVKTGNVSFIDQSNSSFDNIIMMTPKDEASHEILLIVNMML
jgi:hypothetical protein